MSLWLSHCDSCTGAHFQWVTQQISLVFGKLKHTSLLEFVFYVQYVGQWTDVKCFLSVDPCLIVMPPCVGEADRFSLEALRHIHKQLDDDNDGGIEVNESLEVSFRARRLAFLLGLIGVTGTSWVQVSAIDPNYQHREQIATLTIQREVFAASPTKTKCIH